MPNSLFRQALSLIWGHVYAPKRHVKILLPYYYYPLSRQRNIIGYGSITALSSGIQIRRELIKDLVQIKLGVREYIPRWEPSLQDGQIETMALLFLKLPQLK